MISLSEDTKRLAITTKVTALNGDAIGNITLTAQIEEHGGVTFTSSAFLPVALAPHEAAYLAGWLAASL